MTITNGYATLEEIRERLTIGKRRTATTIAFVDGGAGADTITDTALGLEMFPTGARIRVQGSTSNDGYYTVVTGGVAGVITLATGTLTAEIAGDSVTITDVTDVQDDAKLESMVEAISRAIDAELGRRFYVNGADETRYYTARAPDILFPDDDVASITTLGTDADGDGTYEDTWAATDYALLPANAALDGKSYSWIETTAQGSYSFPRGMLNGVKVVGKFGYCASTPARIKELCLLMAEQLFKRKTAIFGVVSSPLGELKQMMRDDPQLQKLAAGFYREV